MDKIENTEAREFRFSALHPFMETHIVRPTEVVQRGRDYVSWGEDNDYPTYLLALYGECTTLRSVANGMIDYIAGDDVDCAVSLQGRWLNRRGQSAREVVRALARDYSLYGGFAVQVVRGLGGNIAEIYPVDFRYIRSNKENDVFYYSEAWDDRRVNRDKVTVYPKYLPDAPSQANSILYYKNVDTQVYPSPVYASAVKACEIERSVDEFHLNAISNQFMADTILNFNNGIPTDETKNEIERAVNEKFGGKENAGRIMLSFNDSMTTRTTVEHLTVEDYGEKYRTLASWARQQIFTAFRANPNLFGIPTENLGFSSEEYEAAFKLFNRTMILPIQRAITEELGRVLGEGAVSIRPFSLEGATTNVR